MPALMLIYSAIDVIASLARMGADPKERFLRWCDEYLVPQLPSGLAALDLYAARCGVLHTLTASSDLSRSGSAKQIVYAWGSASEDDLQRAADSMGKSFVALHIFEISVLLETAVAQTLEDISEDPGRLRGLEAQMDSWFTDELKPETVTEFLRGVDGESEPPQPP